MGADVAKALGRGHRHRRGVTRNDDDVILFAGNDGLQRATLPFPRVSRCYCLTVTSLQIGCCLCVATVKRCQQVSDIVFMLDGNNKYNRHMVDFVFVVGVQGTLILNWFSR